MVYDLFEFLEVFAFYNQRKRAEDFFLKLRICDKLISGNHGEFWMNKVIVQLIFIGLNFNGFF